MCRCPPLLLAVGAKVVDATPLWVDQPVGWSNGTVDAASGSCTSPAVVQVRVNTAGGLVFLAVLSSSLSLGTVVQTNPPMISHASFPIAPTAAEVLGCWVKLVAATLPLGLEAVGGPSVVTRSVVFTATPFAVEAGVTGSVRCIAEAVQHFFLIFSLLATIMSVVASSVKRSRWRSTDGARRTAGTVGRTLTLAVAVVVRRWRIPRKGSISSVVKGFHNFFSLFSVRVMLANRMVVGRNPRHVAVVALAVAVTVAVGVRRCVVAFEGLVLRFSSV